LQNSVGEILGGVGGSYDFAQAWRAKPEKRIVEKDAFPSGLTMNNSGPITVCLFVFRRKVALLEQHEQVVVAPKAGLVHAEPRLLGLDVDIRRSCGG